MSKKNRNRSVDLSDVGISYSVNTDNPVVGQTLEIDIRGCSGVLQVESLQEDKATPNTHIMCDDTLTEPYILYVVADEVSSGFIKITTDTMEEVFIPVNFTDRNIITATMIPDDGTTSVDNTISLTLDNVKGSVEVAPDAGIVVEVVEENSSYVVRSETGDPVAGNIRISGDEIVPLTVSVAFREVAKDLVTVALNPIDGEVEATRPLTVSISNTTSLVELLCDDPEVFITRKEIGSNEFNVVTENEGVYTLLVRGEGVEDTHFTITVTPKIEISVPSLSYTFRQEDLPCYIPLTNVKNTVNCLSSSNDIVGTIIEDNGVYSIEVDATDNRFTRELTGELRLQHEGDDDVVINITLLPQTEKTKMSFNGITIQIEQGRFGKVKVPSRDRNDDIEVIAPKEVTYRVGDDNILYMSSNTPGEYEITVKHTEYLDSTLTLKVREKLSETLPENPDEPVYDLGVVPSNIKITTITEDLVSDVFASTAFKDDRQRCAFLIQRGPEFIRLLGAKICKYQEVMTRANKKLTGAEAAKCNYSLYTALMSVLNLENYYDFREAMKFLVKMFKVYHDDSLKDLNLMRFDNYWRYGDTRLEEFKLLSVFLNKYVEMDGQNVKTNGLVFKQSIISNIIRFCGENFRP